jgi:hypothetical protein
MNGSIAMNKAVKIINEKLKSKLKGQDSKEFIKNSNTSLYNSLKEIVE